ncbi:glycosylated lysosomal membrane protein B-like [Lytechinus pictus]|uniref:glycosylated lysosomal membrane protein B-like n=1 Tax=Lytechinus pictus TaxID=7653 RepID=UPI0030B9E46C
MTATAFMFRCLFLISTITVGVKCDDQIRNVTITYNDGCDIPECKGGNGTFYNLIHFQAKGPTDTIHHVWCSIGSPSLLVARTTKTATMKVDWKNAIARKGGAITFTPKEDVLSVSAFVMSRLLEYDDEKDTADITKVNVTRTVDISDLMWSNVTINSTEKSALFKTVPGMEPAADNGSLTLKVQSLGAEGRSKNLPHLQHMPNTTEFSLILDNLQMNYMKPRFALEMLIVRDQQTSKKSGITLEDKPSIDDEYTPAVFKTYQVLLNGTSKSDRGSFMQWKPIAYTSADRNTEASSPIKTYAVNFTNHYMSSYSIAHAYFGNLSDYDLGSFNISFGIGKDGFYNATKYYAWNSVTGYGTPPSDGLSILIISIISVGLGIPVILIIFGGVIVACQKRIALRKANSLTKYTSING